MSSKKEKLKLILRNSILNSCDCLRNNTRFSSSKLSCSSNNRNCSNNSNSCNNSWSASNRLLRKLTNILRKQRTLWRLRIGEVMWMILRKGWKIRKDLILKKWGGCFRDRVKSFCNVEKRSM